MKKKLSDKDDEEGAENEGAAEEEQFYFFKVLPATSLFSFATSLSFFRTENGRIRTSRTC